MNSKFSRFFFFVISEILMYLSFKNSNLLPPLGKSLQSEWNHDMKNMKLIWLMAK